MLNGSFHGDLEYIEKLLLGKIPFSLVRFGDGEMKIMKGEPLNLLHKGEFNFQGEEILQHQLIESFQHSQENYFVGIGCPCCVGANNFNWMKRNTYLEDESLTWANIFVNSNYSSFRERILESFKNYRITLIAPGSIDNLPIKISKHYRVGPNAWVKNSDLYEKISTQINQSNESGQLFLFCAGPYANILCHKLYNKFPEHTFIDIGSVFNVELGIGKNRGYLRGENTLKKVCEWR